MSTDSCFVCQDDDVEGTLYRVCKCKNTLVHNTCFQRLVSSVPAHSTSCPVCLHDYACESFRCFASSTMFICFHGIVLGMWFCITAYSFFDARSPVVTFFNMLVTTTIAKNLRLRLRVMRHTVHVSDANVQQQRLLTISSPS